MNRIKNILCLLGMHWFGTTWYVMDGCKLDFQDLIVDFWMGYKKCEWCGERKTKSEFVHTEYKKY